MQRLSGLMLHLRRIRQGVRDVPAPILGMIPSAHSSADDRSTPVTGPVPVRAGVVGHGPTRDAAADAVLGRRRVNSGQSTSSLHRQMLGATHPQ